MGKITSILVDYKHVDGWHVFSSADMAGLYVASKRAELAFNDVPLAIKKLVKLNSGVDCTVTAELSYFQFLSLVRNNKPNRAAPQEDAPLWLETQRYALCA